MVWPQRAAEQDCGATPPPGLVPTAPLGFCSAVTLLERGDALVSNDHLVLSSIFFSWLL